MLHLFLFAQAINAEIYCIRYRLFVALRKHACLSVSRCLADATFVEIAGGKVPAGKDSISMWSALKSGGPSPRSEVLLQLAGPDATTGLQEKDAAIRIGPWKLIINVDGRDRCPNSANVSGMSGDAQQNSCFYSNSGWMAMLP